jgi:hypothetical protein
MNKLLTYLLLLMMFVSCEEQTDWDSKKADNDFVVVDGIITNEVKVQTVTIMKPVTSLNGKPKPVSGATVLVSSNLLTHTFHEDLSNPGTYLSDKKFPGIRNQTYSLLITSGNRTYSSKAVLAPEVTVYNFINYQLNENDNKYRFVSSPFPYNPSLSAMYEIQLDWSSAPGYENENQDSCKVKLFYYTLPTLDVSELFAPGIEKITFPSGTIITERRYSLTAEHAAFLRAVLLETMWQGGYFNTASANIPTNLSTGAMGFFGACGVTEKQETAK